MNKLFIALSAASFLCINVASAQMGGVGGATGGTNANELKQDPGVTGGTPGRNVEQNKAMMNEKDSSSSMKMDHGKGMSHKAKMDAMDANHDGMISKEEFMKYHETMYDHMQKNKDGMVDMKSMGMMHHKTSK
jgi:EF hand